VWRLQTRLSPPAREGILDRDIMLLTEHQPVFTLVAGWSGQPDGANSVSRRSGIPVFQVERRQHHLSRARSVGSLSIVDLVGVGLRSLTTCGTWKRWRSNGQRHGASRPRGKAVNRGVWVEARKWQVWALLCAGDLSFTGSVERQPLLEPFRWIRPCGLQGVEVTSMERELSCPGSHG